MSAQPAATRESGATAAIGPAARARPAVPPAIVASTATIAAAAAFALLPFKHALIAGPLAAALLVLAAYDLERRIIPNRIVLPASGIALMANIALFPDRAGEWVLAAVVAALALALPHAVKGSWMGMGDVKLALLLGAGLGWAALSALVLAFLCVFPVALLIMLRGGARARQAAIPFGPFLALGGLIVLYGAHVAGLPAV